MKTYYKIVEFKKGEPHTLYHGLNRKRKLPIGKWLTAEEKIVSDGGSPYLSGFHIFRSQEQAELYKKRFTAPRDLRIVKCFARTVWPKPTNHNVALAEQIRIINEKDQPYCRAS